MARENASGGTCGVPSGAGRGPLYNARLGVRDSIASLRDGITKSWLGPVQADLDQLSKKRQPSPTAARSKSGRRGSRPRPRTSAPTRSASRRAATNSAWRPPAICARSPPRSRSSRTSPAFPATTRRWRSGCAKPRSRRRSKADPQLRPANFSEGPAGVANAVKTLWTNVGAYSNELSPAYVASRRQGRLSPHRERRADHWPRCHRAIGDDRRRPRHSGDGAAQSAGDRTACVAMRSSQRRTPAHAKRGGGRTSHPRDPDRYCARRRGRRLRVGAAPLYSSRRRVVFRDSRTFTTPAATKRKSLRHWR